MVPASGGGGEGAPAVHLQLVEMNRTGEPALTQVDVVQNQVRGIHILLFAQVAALR